MHRRLPGMPSPLSKITDSRAEQDETFATAKKKVHMGPDVGDDPAVPCFIHSGLDRKGALQDWLRHNQADQYQFSPRAKGRARAQAEPPASRHAPAHHRHPRPQPLTPAFPRAPPPHPHPQPQSPSPSPSPGPENGYESDKSSSVSVGPGVDREGPALAPEIEIDTEFDADDDDEEATSLTRQLAATAQGVREVSKQLGRTKVHSRIQHILIVTKARDNRLIALTRDLALYLMQRGGKGHAAQGSGQGQGQGQGPGCASGAACAGSSTGEGPGDGRGGSRDRRDRRDRRACSPGRGMVVYVDAQLKKSKRFDAAGMARDHPELFEPVLRRRASRSANASSTSISTMASGYSARDSRDNGNGNGAGAGASGEGQLRYWTPEMCSNTPQLFDFVITLGGDGTVLFTSWLFQKIVPPVLPFALGSLGFLTNFNFKDYKPIINKVVDEGIRVNLRMRFSCTVYRAVAPDEPTVVNSHGKRKAIRKPGGEILVQQVDREGWEALEGGGGSQDAEADDKEREVLCFTTRPVEQFEVLNDLVVDRGPSPFVSLLEVFGDDHHLTTVQADGLTVSTPTGSTAYSLSAGGSLVHPGIPAILLTPICPHTLSFRPMLLPDGMELRVCVPYNSRSTAWASFDGRGRVELKQGDHIKITASKFPFPTVCADKQSTDWFRSISRTLRWNEREKQKSFVVFEEADTDAKVLAHSDDDPSDDEFDIDDRSTAGERTPDVEPVKPVRLTDGGPVPAVPGGGGGAGAGAETLGPSSSAFVSEAAGAPDGGSGSGGGAGAPSRGRRRLIDETDYDRSGVQSPNRFASGAYSAPPPLSQRHLVRALEKCETDMAGIRLSSRIRAREDALARDTQRHALAQDEAALRDALARVTAERARLDDGDRAPTGGAGGGGGGGTGGESPDSADSVSSLEPIPPAAAGPAAGAGPAGAAGAAPSSATQSVLQPQEWDELRAREHERELRDRDLREREQRELQHQREREREQRGRGRGRQAPPDEFEFRARESSLHRNVPRTESEATLAPLPEYGEYAGDGFDGFAAPVTGERAGAERAGAGAERTPRQGRSRTRSAPRSGYSSAGGSRAGSRIRDDAPELSPSVRSGSTTRRAKAFAFFGNDHSASEISDGE